MPEKSMFFDSTENDERLYSSADFAQFMKIFYSTGVVNGGDSLKVIKSPNKLAVTVQPGKAVIEGRPYWLTETAKELMVPAASSSYARIDRVVLRLDLSVEARNITARILQGQATATPRPPELLRNNNYYDISLAQLYIPANSLLVETLTDERYDTSVCGICQGLYSLDMTDFEDLNQFLGPFTQHIKDTSIHVTTSNKTAWNKKAEKSSSVKSLTLSSTSWTGTEPPFTYSLYVSGVTSTSNQELLPGLNITQKQLDVLQAANLQDGGQASGRLTLKAWGNKPDVNLPIRIIVRGDT